MAEIIRMPKMSDTMEEGVIAGWLKKVGDEVKSGDILAEVETDKATMELESYDDGVLLHIGVKSGDSVPVNEVIAIIGDKGEDVDDILKNLNSTTNEEKVEDIPEEKTEIKSEETKETKSEETVIEKRNDNDRKRIKVSPLAKKLASDKGVNLSEVSGSGDGGRIVKSDIENFSNSILSTVLKMFII